MSAAESWAVQDGQACRATAENSNEHHSRGAATHGDAHEEEKGAPLWAIVNTATARQIVREHHLILISAVRSSSKLLYINN